nr:ribonuclease H-like domain-containing protein [Tanacetum cinerariifolium]
MGQPVYMFQQAYLGSSGREMILLNAFHVVTLLDPAQGNWNMDTCASSHLNDSVTSLSDVLNMCIYSSVSCDSTGDLYPITKPSTIPDAFLTNETLSHYKPRLLVNGSTQIEGVAVNETFSPIVKPCTIRAVLSLVTSRHWSVHQLDDSSGIFLSQRKYAVEILERAHIGNYNPSRTPVDTESKLGDDGDPVSDPTLYRSLAGSLQYLTITRPDISYAIQQICLYMNDPQEPHFLALKRILWPQTKYYGPGEVLGFGPQSYERVIKYYGDVGPGLGWEYFGLQLWKE